MRLTNRCGDGIAFKLSLCLCVFVSLCLKWARLIQNRLGIWDMAKAAQAKGAEAAKPYVVFARRFRPQTFADVAGQTAVTAALRQALTSGRLAQAYLLCGPRGVGKTSLARIFAKACNCLKGTGPNGVAEEPCNVCDACVSIQNGSSLDVIEMDAATNRGIEEVRSLRENVGISPSELRYKVYIIDEVHMLTREAWNAFLKTLEEPPAHVKFIFATTDPNDVPETILSRCQRFDLRRISLADIVKRLRKICDADSIPYEEAALSRIAGLAKGGLRDAEGMLDQAVNLGGGNISDAIIRELSGAAPDELIFDMLKACAAGNTAEVLAKSHEALEAGADPDDMLSVLSERLRSTVLAKVCGAESPLLEGQTHLKNAYVELGKLLSEDQCLMLIQLFINARRQMRDAAQTRLPLEVALIRASRARDLIDLSKLTSSLESGAGRLPAGGAAPNSSGRPPPATEGARPNSEGRPAPVNAQPAAPSPALTSASSSSARNAQPASASQSNDWQRAVDLIKAQRGGAVLASAMAHSSAAFDPNAGEVVIGTNSPFYRDALVNPQNQSALKNALSKIYGRDWTIRVTDAPAGQSSSRAVAPASPAAYVAPAPIRKAATGVASTTAPQRSAVVATPAPASNNEQIEGPPQEEWEPEDSAEYVDSGALPLDLPVESAESLAAPLPVEDSDRDVSPPARELKIDPPVVSKTRAPTRMVAIDSKLVEGLPIVQTILKVTGGLLLEVSKSKKKDDIGP